MRGELQDRSARQIERFGHGREIVGDVAAEVRRIVGVDGDQEAALHEGDHVVLVERGKDLQPHVGEGTNGEGDLVGHQPFDQAVVLKATHAVIDAPRLQHSEGFPDVFGRALLAGVRHPRKAHQAGLREDPAELGGRVADLGRVEADCRQEVRERTRRLQGPQCILLAAVA